MCTKISHLTNTFKIILSLFFVFVPVHQSQAQSSNLEPVAITSITHPDSAKRYVSNDPEFAWVLPDTVTEVKTSIGLSPEGVPSVRYAPPISYKKVENLPEGTYYFNLQAKTDTGWTPVSRYQIHIDKKGEVAATSTSGVSEGLIPDAVEPIVAPKIVQYSQRIEEGEIVKIIGDAQPRTNIEVRIKDGDVIIFREIVKTDELGSFSLILSKTIPAGEYLLSAVSIKSDGMYSLESSEMMMKVHSVFLTHLIDTVLRYFSIFILILIAVVGIVTISIFSWHKVKKMHEYLKGKSEEEVVEPSVVETPFMSIQMAIENRLMELSSIKRKNMKIKEEIVFLKEFGVYLAKAKDILEHEDAGEEAKEG